MACMDVKLFHSYISAALPVFVCSDDCEYCHSSLLLRPGAVIREFRLGAQLCFVGMIFLLFDLPILTSHRVPS